MHERHTVALLLLLAVPVRAQLVVSTTSMPVRALPAPVASSSVMLKSVGGIRALSDGRLLVNDQTAHRLLLLDQNLALVTVIADSTLSTNKAYGAVIGGLLAFRGDSSLFVDPSSLSILVIDPAGKLARTMAVPRAEDAGAMTGGVRGELAFDARGALVYRRTARAGSQPVGSQMAADSAIIVRLELASRKLDTAAFFKIQKSGMTFTRDADGRYSGTNVYFAVMPVVDEWAMMSDGTIAIVRGQDYHVQFIAPDGRITHAPKISFEWARMSDTAKVIWVDRTREALVRQSASGPQATGRPIQFVLPEPSELPDYRPAFATAAVRADAENRIWVKTTKTGSTPIDLVYDVIDRTGTRVERFSAPNNSAIAGFGPNGTMYLAVRDSSGLRLTKVMTH